MERSDLTLNRAVVWLAPGASAPAGLLGALSAKGLRVTLVVDAAAALREVIRSGSRRVVLCEPQALPRVDELVETLRAYYPDTVCWRFDVDPGATHSDPATGGTLSTINGDLIGPSEQAARLDAHQAKARASLQRESSETPHEPELPERLVTEDEVTMLLGPVDHADAPPEDAP